MAKWTSLSGRIGSGVGVVTSTVYSSTLAADCRLPKSVAPIPGRCGSAKSSTAATIASALKGSPLLNVTPWRSLKRQVVGWTMVQLSASFGTILPDALSRAVRWS
jgi:hypothetical protein